MRRTRLMAGSFPRSLPGRLPHAPPRRGRGYRGVPGGEKLALDGDPRAVPLPRPLMGSAEPHFSFAGLKSAVLRAKEGKWNTPQAEQTAAEYSDADIAASFQQAAIDCIIDRTRRALRDMGEVTALVVAGG